MLEISVHECADDLSEDDIPKRTKQKRFTINDDEHHEDNELPRSSDTSEHKTADKSKDSECPESPEERTLPEEPVYSLNNKKELILETTSSETPLAEICDAESNDDDAAVPQSSPQSNVALPYHKAKQWTLKEFLQHRPRFASTVPQSSKAYSAAAALKMSAEQLALISKNMEEREKQVKEFYKSESEDDEASEKSPRIVSEDSTNGTQTETLPDDAATTNPSPETEEQSPDVPKTKLELLQEKLKDVQPKLSGAPNYLIDLDSGSTKPNEITRFINRFAQHTSQLPRKHSTIATKVVSVSQGGSIHTEDVAFAVHEEDAPPPVEKPGVALHKLRVDLEEQMAQRRNEIWAQKVQTKVVDSEPEDVDSNQAQNDDCEIDKLLDDEEEGEFTNDDDDSSDSDDDEVQSVKVKHLKRIIPTVDDDSDDDSACKAMDSTASLADDEDFVPAAQKLSHRTPNKQPFAQSKSDLAFLSPVCRLTGLQSFDATGKFLQNSPGSPAIKLNELSPLTQKGWAKSLFADTSPTKQDEEPTANVEIHTECIDSQPSTQDLMELCSGDFTNDSKTEEMSTNSERLRFQPQTKNDEAQTTNKTRILHVDASHAKEQQHIDEDDDRLISQLIDEEELEVFKKKFESPVVLPSCRDGAASEANKKIATKICFDSEVIAEEDEEEEENYQLQKPRFIKTNKLEDSDEEEIHDDVELDYDSEENEIVVEKTNKFQISEFVENEAELSESEWGSEDEDERNLDELELNEADMEYFNEKKLRRDIEKIHMRQVLDDDKRKIKVLQELYMDEDEELKGAGRQRQFRWRNVDASETNMEKSTEQNEAVNSDEDDDGNEEEWRKTRFQRELFLQQQKKKQNNDQQLPDISLPSNSNVLKLGNFKQVARQASSRNSQRGSFLTRKDQVLERVAEYTKIGEKLITSTKNSRNFVFQTVKVNSNDDGKKRKPQEEGTPVALKRLRLAGLSPGQRVAKKSKARLFVTDTW